MGSKKREGIQRYIKISTRQSSKDFTVHFKLVQFGRHFCLFLPYKSCQPSSAPLARPGPVKVFIGECVKRIVWQPPISRQPVQPGLPTIPFLPPFPPLSIAKFYPSDQTQRAKLCYACTSAVHSLSLVRKKEEHTHRYTAQLHRTVQES